MSDIETRFRALQDQIRQAELHAHRPPGSVTLIAVSKTRPVAEILALAHTGQRHFAENYLQESIPKIQACANADLIWHFIGRIQSNKTKEIARHYAWVHSIDGFPVAAALNKHRPPSLPPLNVCVQINIHQEPRKGGVSLQEWPELALSISKLPNLFLRGIMVMSPEHSTLVQQHSCFAKAREALLSLKPTIPLLDTLSMGMSGDLVPAIMEGSTMVRIGSALFGVRDPSQK